MSGPAWERVSGGRVVKIMLEDVIEALDAARSVMLKEMATNRVIKESPQMSALYEKHRDILDIVRGRFAEAGVVQDRGPRSAIPKKRRKQ